MFGGIILLGMAAQLTPSYGTVLHHPQNIQQDPSGSLEEIEKQLADQSAEEARLREEAQERAREIQTLRQNLIQTASSIQESEREIARIERELERLSVEEAQATAQLEAEKGNISEVLAAIQAFEMSRPPALLVSPGDANRAARSALLLSEATPALAKKAEAIGLILDRLNLAKTALSDQRAAYQATATSLASRRQILGEQLTRKEEERDVAQRLAAAAQRETAALAAKATSLKDVVDRLQKLAYSVTPRVKPERNTVLAGPVKPAANQSENNPQDNNSKGIEIIVNSTSETTRNSANLDRGSLRVDSNPETFRPARAFAAARGALRAPVVGTLSGKFGQTGADGERLDGIRIDARDQAIVTAPFEAKIVFAQDWGLAGNMIVMDVGAGYHLLLIGIGQFLVDAGQIVKAGEPLAAMIGDEAALDLQIRKNGEPVNPLLWFQLDS